MFDVASLTKYQTLLVGFSGGLDSTVLLHTLIQSPELRAKTIAVHIHHNLSSNADFWQAHCQRICEDWGVSFRAFHVQIGSSNIEQEARLKRYQIFSELLTAEGCLLLGHHQDDIAETLLLHLMRGSGVKGLGGIRAEYPFANGFLYRPLLDFSRIDIQAYAAVHELSWIEDESNQNRYFSRNYIRHEVLPRLRHRWPNACQKLAECAEHVQEAQDNLFDLAELDCPALANPLYVLDYTHLLGLSERRLVNVILTWFYRLHVPMPNTSTLKRIISEVVRAKSDAVPIVEWGEYLLRRYQNKLYLLFQKEQSQSLENLNWSSFPAPLFLNEREYLLAIPAKTGIFIPPHAQVEIRYRSGGETLRRHQQTQLLKKLFQAHAVPPWLRQSIPLVYVNGELVCVVDFWDRDPYDGANLSYLYQIQRRSRNDDV